VDAWWKNEQAREGAKEKPCGAAQILKTFSGKTAARFPEGFGLFVHETRAKANHREIYVHFCT
jgi:hypothetical protein